jgi:transcriptional regulator with XRE-family HTH domain
MSQNNTSFGGEQGELASDQLSASLAHMSEDQQNRAIGGRIKQARRTLGLKQQTIADRAGVTRSAVSAWELGQGIKRSNLVVFAQMVGVSPDWLLTGVGAAPEPAAPKTVLDIVQLEVILAGLLEIMGRTEGQAQELAKAILRASERPLGSAPTPPDPALMKRLAQFLARMYAP